MTLKMPFKKDEPYRFISLRRFLCGSHHHQYRHHHFSRIYNNKFVQNSGIVDKEVIRDTAQRETEGYRCSSCSKSSRHHRNYPNHQSPSSSHVRLVYVDGKFDYSLSTLGKLPEGTYMGGLKNLPEEYKVLRSAQF